MTPKALEATFARSFAPRLRAALANPRCPLRPHHVYTPPWRNDVPARAFPALLDMPEGLHATAHLRLRALAAWTALLDGAFP